MSDPVIDLLIIDLLKILFAGLLAAVVCRRVGVSPLVGYLIAGAIIGPGGFRWVLDRHHEISHLAEAGVFLLLFTIGLEFSLEELGRLGKSLLIGGGTQMGMVAIPVALFVWFLGVSIPTAVLIGSALAFSSTVLVFKALAEVGQTATRSGRRAIAILLFQDAALIPLLLLIPLLTPATEQPSGWDYLWLAVTSLSFIGSIFVARYLLRKWIIPRLAGFRSPELVVLFTLVLLGGMTYITYRVGLPPAVGAFSAGLVLGGNRWSAQMDALVLPFRESFAAVFFISLGMFFNPDIFLNKPGWMFLSLLALLLIKSVAAILALKLTGLSWPSAFGIGVGLAHVGEFAFVLLLLGKEKQLIQPDTYQLLLSLAFCTLLLTPMQLKWGLRWTATEWQEEEKNGLTLRRSEPRTLVIGLGPIGRRVTSYLESNGMEVGLIDMSPVNLYSFAQQGFRTTSGDATQVDVLSSVGAEQANMVIVCVPDDLTACEIVRQFRKLNDTATVVARCRYESNEELLVKAGATQVVSEERSASQDLVRKLIAPDAE